MFRAIISDGRSGDKRLLIGLSFANLDRFREQPMDTFITIKASETGLPMDILIFSGETEEKCAEVVKNMPKSTKIILISPR